MTKKPFYRLTNGGTEAKNYNEPMFVDTMQYAYAIKRIDGAWYDVECAAIAIHEFDNRQKVITN